MILNQRMTILLCVFRLLKDLRKNFKNCKLKYTNSIVQRAGFVDFHEVILNCSDLTSHPGGIKLVQCLKSLKKRARGNFLCTDVKPFIYQITLVNQSNHPTTMPLPITCHCWKVKKIKKKTKQLTIDQI